MPTASMEHSRLDPAAEQTLLAEVTDAARDAANGIIRTSESLRAAMDYILHVATPGTWARIADETGLFQTVDRFRAFMTANAW